VVTALLIPQRTTDHRPLTVIDVIRLFNWVKKQVNHLHQPGKFVKTPKNKTASPELGRLQVFA